MHKLRSLTRLVFVFISVATVTACTTAPTSFSNILSAPTVQKLPPAPTPEPLTTKTQGEVSHDDGVVVAIPPNLTATPKSARKSNGKKKKPIAKISATAATASSSDVGQGFRALESADDCCGTGCATPCLTDATTGGTVVNIPQSGDEHRALEGADDCCGTGCSKACSVEQ